jgi:V8-like Glu-specific endopeptidase
MLHPVIDDLRTLIREGELELALGRLTPLVRERMPRHLNEALLQAARTAELRKKHRSGTLTDEVHTAQFNRLVVDMLFFVDALGREPAWTSGGAAAPPMTAIPPTSKIDSREKIIGGVSCLKSLAWLRRGLEVSRAVCRILPPNGARGSGFLTMGGHVVTNHHVLPTQKLAEKAVVEFNYEEDIDGRTLPVTRYRVLPGSWRADEGLDCAVLSLIPDDAMPLFSMWNPLDLATDATPALGEHVTIVQHPEGGLKQIAITANQIVNIFDHRLQYTTDTLPGSSGAPVFDDRWRVVAVHHAGGHLEKNSNGERIYANEGILARYVASALGLASVA